MAESENILILATFGRAYFSLRLAATPVVKDRLTRQDVGSVKVSGTAIRLEWPRLSKTCIAVPIRVEVHPRLASVEPITK